jgi:hypothetical protein
MVSFKKFNIKKVVVSFLILISLASFGICYGCNEDEAVTNSLQTLNGWFHKEEKLEALEFFMQQVEGGKYFYEAEEAAIYGMDSYYATVRGCALGVLRMLVKQGHSFKSAGEAANKSINTDNWRIASYLYESLVDQGQSFDQAIKVASQLIFTEDFWMKKERSALRLFEHLWKQGQGIKEAKELANYGIRWGREHQEMQGGLRLYQHLLRNGHAFEEAAATVSGMIESEVYYKRIITLSVYENLVKFGNYALEEARAAAAKAIKATDKYERESALDVYLALVERKFAIAEAVDAVEREIKLIGMSLTAVRSPVTKLYNELYNTPQFLDH